jgi:hypothetical protein
MNSFFYRAFFCEIKSFHYESSSGLIPKELLVHLGGFCLQASSGREGCFLCLDVRLAARRCLVPGGCWLGQSA